MNNPLFMALLAAALMGGQVLAEEYKLSDYIGSDTPLTLSQGDIVHVDTDRPIHSLQFNDNEKATILYEMATPLVYQNSIDISRGTSCDIRATQDVTQTWLNVLSRHYGEVILFDYSDSAAEGFPCDKLPSFFGAKTGDTLTITGGEISATVTFKGLVYSALELRENEIGYIITALDYGFEKAQVLSVVSGSQGFTVNPVSAIPEPGTATLSLLAIAGLAAHRRRK